MAQVYVSYARHDLNAALPIIEAINEAGLNVWHHREPSAGVDWAIEMQRQIEEAQCVVVLWSKAAAQSSFVEREIQIHHAAIQAWSLNRLVLAALDDTPLPVGLRDLPNISIRSRFDLEQLIERARAVVSQQQQESEERRRQEEERRRRESAERRRREIPALEVEAAEKGQSEKKVRSEKPLPTRSAPAASASGMLWLIIAVVLTGSMTWYQDLPILALLLLVAAIGAAFGAAAVWAWTRTRRSRLRSTPEPYTTLLEVPAASEGVRVFVSYSRQDGPTVEQLVQEMEQLGHKVWIDRKSISPQRYAAPIVAAIRDSRFVALMCSQSAFTSDHVIREVYVAGDFKKSFIVFQLDSTKFPDEIHYFLSGYPRIPVATTDQQKLRSEIARLLAA